MFKTIQLDNNNKRPIKTSIQIDTIVMVQAI